MRGEQRRNARYDPSSPTGLRWEDGRIAGARLGRYYAFSKKRVLCHRYVWELHNGPIPEGMEVDHKNQDKLDNRIENLRLATRSENRCNVPAYSNNKTGVKGLSWATDKEAWVGKIKINGKVYRKQDKDREVVVQWLRETRPLLHKEYAYA
jgi:hypothetical protein